MVPMSANDRGRSGSEPAGASSPSPSMASKLARGTVADRDLPTGGGEMHSPDPEARLATSSDPRTPERLPTDPEVRPTRRASRSGSIGPDTTTEDAGPADIATDIAEAEAPGG
jgi:hypothetical protein